MPSKEGHQYLTVVVDHDSARLVWAAPGRSAATLHKFFDVLGPEWVAKITYVSADGDNWITTVIRRRCPNAVRCADAFHVVAGATDAVDRVRRRACDEASGRGAGRRDVAGAARHS